MINVASNAARSVSLREVLEDDLEMLFEHQLDPDALSMAAFPSRDRDAHLAHWHRILADDSVTAATVLFEGSVAGDIVSWDNEGEREVGYWIGRSFWARALPPRHWLTFSMTWMARRYALMWQDRTWARSGSWRSAASR